VPILLRSEADILRLSSITDVYVNPLDLRGHMTTGLAEVLSEHFGGTVREDYEAACKEGKIQIGQLWLWTSTQTSQVLANIPTKRHYADPTDEDHLRRSLQALRTYLQEHPFHRVTMPLLGGALGQMPMDDAETMHREYLDDLPNIIQISLRPATFKDGPPKYLAVIGSRALTDRAYVEETLQKAFVRWSMKPSDFKAMISGGAPRGVDVFACGTSMKDVSYTESIAAKLGMRPIIAEADWKRYGRSAGYKRNTTVADIATHCVACLDERKDPSVGTRQTLRLLRDWNTAYPDKTKPIVAVSYKKETPSFEPVK